MSPRAWVPRRLREPVVRDEPIRAWKRAYVAVDERGVTTYTGIGQGMEYRVVDEAVCMHMINRYARRPYAPPLMQHSVPALDCTCGFYANKHPADAADYGGGGSSALLEVELYGRVIVCERGYRAQKQRVLAIHAPRACSTTTYERVEVTTFGDAVARYATFRIRCAGKAEFQSGSQLLCNHCASCMPSHDLRPWTPEPVHCDTEWYWDGV